MSEGLDEGPFMVAVSGEEVKPRTLRVTGQAHLPTSYCFPQTCLSMRASYPRLLHGVCLAGLNCQSLDYGLGLLSNRPPVSVLDSDFKGLGFASRLCLHVTTFRKCGYRKTTLLIYVLVIISLFVYYYL